MIMLIILVGGLTRLTDSGLSITTWELFVGLMPPISNDKWIEYNQSGDLIIDGLYKNGMPFNGSFKGEFYLGISI